LWRPAGGAYNVDNVLKVMVKGLEEELQARMDGKLVNAMKGNHPSPAIDAEFIKKSGRKDSSENKATSNNKNNNSTSQIQQQGADISIPFRKVARWVRNSK
jgi:hypothetical protein